MTVIVIEGELVIAQLDDMNEDGSSSSSEGNKTINFKRLLGQVYTSC